MSKEIPRSRLQTRLQPRSRGSNGWGGCSAWRSRKVIQTDLPRSNTWGWMGEEWGWGATSATGRHQERAVIIMIITTRQWPKSVGHVQTEPWKGKTLKTMLHLKLINQAFPLNKLDISVSTGTKKAFLRLRTMGGWGVEIITAGANGRHWWKVSKNKTPIQMALHIHPVQLTKLPWSHDVNDTWFLVA